MKEVYKQIGEINGVEIRKDKENIQIKFIKKTRNNAWVLALIQQKVLSEFVYEKTKSKFPTLDTSTVFANTKFSFVWKKTRNGHTYWKNIANKITYAKRQLSEE